MVQNGHDLFQALLVLFNSKSPITDERFCSYLLGLHIDFRNKTAFQVSFLSYVLQAMEYALVDYIDLHLFQCFDQSDANSCALVKTGSRIIAQLAIRSSLSEDSKVFSVDFFSVCIRKQLDLLCRLPKPSTIAIAKVCTGL